MPIKLEIFPYKEKGKFWSHDLYYRHLIGVNRPEDPNSGGMHQIYCEIAYGYLVDSSLHAISSAEVECFRS